MPYWMLGVGRECLLIAVRLKESTFFSIHGLSFDFSHFCSSGDKTEILLLARH